jgi:hypothetical protein
MNCLQNLLLIILITVVLLVLTQTNKKDTVNEEFSVIDSLISGNSVPTKDLDDINSKLDDKDENKILIRDINRELAASRKRESIQEKKN